MYLAFSALDIKQTEIEPNPGFSYLKKKKKKGFTFSSHFHLVIFGYYKWFSLAQLVPRQFPSHLTNDSWCLCATLASLIIMPMTGPHSLEKCVSVCACD